MIERSGLNGETWLIELVFCNSCHRLQVLQSDVYSHALNAAIPLWRQSHSPHFSSIHPIYDAALDADQKYALLADEAESQIPRIVPLASGGGGEVFAAPTDHKVSFPNFPSTSASAATLVTLLENVPLFHGTTRVWKIDIWSLHFWHWSSNLWLLKVS